MAFSVPADRYHGAEDFESYVAGAQKNKDLWLALYRTLPLPEEVVQRAAAIPGRWHILVLSEDWCSDAMSSVPLIQRLVERVPSLDLRILARDRNDDLMAAHLTNGTRSIPVVMVLDEDFEERGWWGPRPAALQAWMLAEGLELPKEERNKLKRQWYARDRGATALDEVVSLLERSAATFRGRVGPGFRPSTAAPGSGE